MDRQVKPKLLVLHTYQQRTEQGTVFQVEWTPRILCCQTHRFRLAFWLRELAQIHQGQRNHAGCSVNNLDGFATNNFEGRAPNLMATNNFKQAPLQRGQVKRAVAVNSHSLVVERDVTCHLPVEPYLLLSERKRYGYIVWPRTN